MSLDPRWAMNLSNASCKPATVVSLDADKRQRERADTTIAAAIVERGWWRWWWWVVVVVLVVVALEGSGDRMGAKCC